MRMLAVLTHTFLNTRMGIRENEGGKIDPPHQKTSSLNKWTELEQGWGHT